MNVRQTALALALAGGTALSIPMLFDREGAVLLESVRDDPTATQPTPLGPTTVSAPTSIEPRARSTVSRPPDWTQRFHESSDDFLLSQQLANAALIGDPRANYILSEVLLRCEVYRRTLMPYTDGTMAERVEFYLANGNLPEFERNRFRRGALRCQRLFNEDPFEGSGLPEEAGDFRFWSSRALEAGDPVAIMNRVARSAIDRRTAGRAAEGRASREALVNDLRRVVFSNDTAALLMVGGLLSNPSIAEDLNQGFAWIVAACELGNDCSNANAALGSACVDMGTCVPGQTLVDAMQRDFGPAKYAAIYANAQDIQYKIRTNDWDGLQQYLQIKD